MHTWRMPRRNAALDVAQSRSGRGAKRKILPYPKTNLIFQYVSSYLTTEICVIIDVVKFITILRSWLSKSVYIYIYIYIYISLKRTNMTGCLDQLSRNGPMDPNPCIGRRRRYIYIYIYIYMYIMTERSVLDFIGLTGKITWIRARWSIGCGLDSRGSQ
jgi:hypothetical protein